MTIHFYKYCAIHRRLMEREYRKGKHGFYCPVCREEKLRKMRPTLEEFIKSG